MGLLKKKKNLIQRNKSCPQAWGGLTGKSDSEPGQAGRAQRLMGAVHAGGGGPGVSSNLSSGSQNRWLRVLSGPPKAEGEQSADLDSVLSEGGRRDIDQCRPARLHPDSPQGPWSSPLGYLQESLLATPSV